VSRFRDRHQVEFWTASIVRLLRDFTGVSLNPQRVSFAHPAKKGVREMSSYFGCNVEFGAAADEVVFARSAGNLPLVNADPHLNRVLITICEAAVARRTAIRGTVRTRVENEIAILLPHGKARVDNKGVDGLVNGIAAMLGGSSGRLRRLQTGFVRSYALTMLGGSILVVAALLAVRYS